jgi:hypothetical protein
MAQFVEVLSHKTEVPVLISGAVLGNVRVT